MYICVCVYIYIYIHKTTDSQTLSTQQGTRLAEAHSLNPEMLTSISYTSVISKKAS